jgi:HK97 family phage major capsid protein
MNAARKVFASEKDARAAGAYYAALCGQPWALKRNEYPIVKAVAEGVNSSGGFLVPTELSRAIIELRDIRGAYRAGCGGATPMKSDLDQIPRRVGALSASFTAEGAAISESSASWDNVALVAKKLAVLTRSSTELSEDSAASFGETLTREIAYAFSAKEDDCGFNGDGTSTYGGIRGITQLLIDGGHNAGKVAAAGGHPTFKLLDGTDIAAVIAALPSHALADAAWYISNFGYATTFCRLAATSGGIVNTTVNGVVMPSFLGWPVRITPVLPQVGTTLNGSVMLMFGNLAQAATLGETRGISIAVSMQRYMDQDMAAWRATERIDAVNHDVGDNTNAGPIVGLVGTT